MQKQRVECFETQLLTSIEERDANPFLKRCSNCMDFGDDYCYLAHVLLYVSIRVSTTYQLCYRMTFHYDHHRSTVHRNIGTSCLAHVLNSIVFITVGTILNFHHASIWIARLLDASHSQHTFVQSSLIDSIYMNAATATIQIRIRLYKLSFRITLGAYL